MLILGYDFARPLRLRNMNRHDLLGEDSGPLSLGSPLLRAKSEVVLRASVDPISGGDVLGCLWHRGGAILLRQLGIHEAPSHGGVVNLRSSGKSRVRPWDDHRRAAHTFHSTSHTELKFILGNRSVR